MSLTIGVAGKGRDDDLLFVDGVFADTALVGGSAGMGDSIYGIARVVPAFDAESCQPAEFVNRRSSKGFPFISLFVIGPKRGAKTSIYCASSPDVEGESGKYYKKRKEAKSGKISYDEELARKLWEISAKLTNLKP